MATNLLKGPLPQAPVVARPIRLAPSAASLSTAAASASGVAAVAVSPTIFSNADRAECPRSQGAVGGRLWGGLPNLETQVPALFKGVIDQINRHPQWASVVTLGLIYLVHGPAAAVAASWILQTMTAKAYTFADRAPELAGIQKQLVRLLGEDSFSNQRAVLYAYGPDAYGKLREAGNQRLPLAELILAVTAQHGPEKAARIFSFLGKSAQLQEAWNLLDGNYRTIHSHDFAKDGWGNIAFQDTLGEAYQMLEEALRSFSEHEISWEIEPISADIDKIISGKRGGAPILHRFALVEQLALHPVRMTLDFVDNLMVKRPAGIAEVKSKFVQVAIVEPLSIGPVESSEFYKIPTEALPKVWDIDLDLAEMTGEYLMSVPFMTLVAAAMDMNLLKPEEIPLIGKSILNERNFLGSVIDRLVRKMESGDFSKIVKNLDLMAKGAGKTSAWEVVKTHWENYLASSSPQVSVSPQASQLPKVAISAGSSTVSFELTIWPDNTIAIDSNSMERALTPLSSSALIQVLNALFADQRIQKDEIKLEEDAYLQIARVLGRHVARGDRAAKDYFETTIFQYFYGNDYAEFAQNLRAAFDQGRNS